MLAEFFGDFLDIIERHAGQPPLACLGSEVLRPLDVMGQQMNVNLDLTARSMKMMSPQQLLPMASFSPESVKNFFDTETSLIGSLVKPHKPKGAGRAKPGRGRTRQSKAVAV